MDECIDSLGTSKVFSTSDTNYGYWKIEMDRTDIGKTYFVGNNGLYRYKRMPFGLETALATFQRAMDVIPAVITWQYGLAYIDDIIIFSPTLEVLTNHVEST